MADVDQDASGVSPVVYAVVGVVGATVLELLMAHMGGHTSDLLGHAMDQAVRSAGRTLTHAEMGHVNDQLRGWLFAETAARWLVVACECGLAFWVGRRAAPKWGWGIFVAAPRLLVGVAASFWLLWRTTGLIEYVIHSCLWDVLYASAIVIAAFVGGSLFWRSKGNAASGLRDGLNASS